MADIQNRKKRSMVAIEEGMVTGMRLFESQMIREQMSGRKSANFGLKRQTGNLARSWFVNAMHTAGTYIVSWATRTKYAATHQYGRFQRIGRSRGFRIPKRLYLLEAFKKKGLQLISREVARKLYKGAS